MNVNNELFDIYLAEMNEHLELLDESLLKLDKDYNDSNIINTIFRVFHTMKGSTATMGYYHTSEVIHIVEDMLQAIRDGRITVNSELIQILFKCHDIIEEYVKILSNTKKEVFNNPEFIEIVKEYTQKNAIAKITKEISNQEPERISVELSINHIELDYIKRKVSIGFKPYTLYIRIDDECPFKAVRAWMAFNEIEKISEIIKSNPEKPKDEDFSDSSYSFKGNEIKIIILSSMTDEEILNELNSVLLEIEQIKIEDYVFEEDRMSILVNDIIESNNSGDLSIEEEFPNNENVEVKKGNELKIKPEIKSQTKTDNKSEDNIEQKSQSFIRIPEQKVDSLVDMLGELLIIQSLHKQEINEFLSESSKDVSKISNTILRMERITKDVQTISMSLRMVSLKQSFQKLLRIGRDTAIEVNKNINFTLSGENTEIDRSVVEKIQDPLMHLIRNAVSHGIESEKDRIKKGKPAQGQIELNAYNKRGFVFIEITDDGNGILIDKIYKKAKEKNLIDTTRNYTDDEILRFIYLPGFSTEEKINNISGRGVGMNVVETEILKIGGRMEIINRPQSGCTIVLKIPINLATINGTVIELFDESYIIPTLHIKQLLKPDDSQWVNIKGKPDMIKIRNEVIQVVPIEKIMGIKDKHFDYRDGMVIVIELERKVRALPIKAVIGKQEIVVKPLGPDFRSLNFASGATILGDGRVALILDIESLF